MHLRSRSRWVKPALIIIITTTSPTTAALTATRTPSPGQGLTTPSSSRHRWEEEGDSGETRGKLRCCRGLSIVPGRQREHMHRRCDHHRGLQSSARQRLHLAGVGVMRRSVGPARSSRETNGGALVRYLNIRVQYGDAKIADLQAHFVRYLKIRLYSMAVQK